MIKQILKEEGRKEGLLEGRVEGRVEGLQEERFKLLSRMLMKKYRRPLNELSILEGLRSEDLLELFDLMIDCESYSEIKEWIRQRKSGNLS